MIKHHYILIKKIFYIFLINIMSCNCDPKTVCKKVCKRAFNGWINSPEFSLKVNEAKKATLTFNDVRKFSLYQIYNEFNKKLNCDRTVIVIKPENYNKILKNFNKRTCYLEFEPKPEIGKHCQVAFNLCSSQYNEKTNNITLEVVVDKFFIDGIKKPIQDINGIYCQCNIDTGTVQCVKRSNGKSFCIRCHKTDSGGSICTSPYFNPGPS